ELHAVLADDAAKLGVIEEALREYARFFGSARPVEQTYIRLRVNELVDKLSEVDAKKMWSALPHDTVVGAALKRRIPGEQPEFFVSRQRRPLCHAEARSTFFLRQPRRVCRPIH